MVNVLVKLDFYLMMFSFSFVRKKNCQQQQLRDHSESEQTELNTEFPYL